MCYTEDGVIDVPICMYMCVLAGQRDCTGSGSRQSQMSYCLLDNNIPIGGKHDRFVQLIKNSVLLHHGPGRF